MSLTEILASGGGSLFLLLTLVQISPLRVNPWSWIAKSVGNALNKDLNAKIVEMDKKVASMNENVEKIDSKVNSLGDKVDSIDGQVKELDTQVKDLDEKIEEVEKTSEERDIILCRARMLRFGDEILHGSNHSKDHFDQILLDCTKYENYCKQHPGFLNNITEHTIDLINNTYDKCMKEKTFL